jgi:hypothetical protein
MSIVSHIFPSLILSENGEEEVDHDNEDAADDDTKDTTNNDNGDDNDYEDNKTLMPSKEKLVAAQKTAAKEQNEDGKIMQLPVPKPPAISTFSIEAADPLTISYFADSVHDYTGLVI